MKSLRPLLLAVLTLSVPAVSYASEPGALYRQYEGKTVKVRIADVKDSTAGHEVDPSVVKSALESALKNRKSIHFQIVDGTAPADLVITADLQEFYWTDHDPVDMLGGAAMAAMDAAVVEDYARIQADLSVSDAKKDTVLWKDRVIATVTKKPMSKTESIPVVAEDLAKVFVKECFARKR